MKNKIYVSAILLISLVSFTQAGKYGMAGCGLGSLVLGTQNSTGPQILAATTNNIIVPQTSAITTGTSNCADDGVVLKDKELEFYAEANLDALQVEMAQGEGENLNAFASLYGCGNESGISTFNSLMQQHYLLIFPDASIKSAEMLGNIQTVVDGNQELIIACSEIN